MPLEQTTAMTPDPGDGSAGRHKLWELDAGSHCSIIGTCLSLDDLHRIIRKAELRIGPDAQDYDIHGYFVTWAGSRSPLSKLVHKTLDRKYATQLARFRRSSTAEELWDLWRQSTATGDIAGAYWALMTHKAAPRTMCIRAHNEVHMLSHLMGKSSRQDLKRQRELEKTCAQLAERLAESRARADAILQERELRIRSLEILLARVPTVPRDAAPPVGPELRKREVQFDKLRARFATLERRLRAERARARAAETRVRELQGNGCLQLPATLPRLPSSQGSRLDEHPGEPTFGRRSEADLQGRALLYVGGYPNLMPHLRAYVERMGGAFLYHDGGIEAQTAKLPGLVSQADAVFCPVVCISHEACLRLKHLCMRHGKRFVLLRSAGLSGFGAALTEMTNALTDRAKA
jgi:Uncharacterized protein conserved in bacteria (DUF2325)